MNAPLPRLALLALAATLGACLSSSSKPPSPESEPAFARLVALKGDWVSADAPDSGKGPPAATYRVTAGGSAVIETLFPGQPEEMVSVFTRNGRGIALTHYCMVGNQPHMIATALEGDVLDFAFVGGVSFDPSTDMHMHSVTFTLVSPDELRSEWQGWVDGRADPGHTGRFHLVRRKS